MSHQTIDLLYAVTGQSLYFDAPEGRPSSVTSSTVYETSTGDDGTAESATTGSAAVEVAPNTTTNSDAGPGAVLTDEREVDPLVATGIAVGRTYLLTNEEGAKERVMVQALGTDTVVTLRNPLQNYYVAGATFQTTRITHAIDSTWVADKSNLSGDFDPNPRYRWRLVYVVSSVTYAHDLYFDLLRYAARHDVTPIDVDIRAPGWLNRLDRDDRLSQGRLIIDEAFQVIKFDLYNLSTPDQAIRNREAVNELVKLKAIEMVAGTDTAARQYSDRLAQLIANAKVHTATDSSGASAPADKRPAWRR